MKKRQFIKILHQFDRLIKGSVDLYLTLIESYGDGEKGLGIDMIQLSIMMLLDWKADQNKIIVGKENRVADLILYETDFIPEQSLQFEGQIIWHYKKKNLPAELKQDCKIHFDIENLEKKRIPYRIDFS